VTSIKFVYPISSLLLITCKIQQSLRKHRLAGKAIDGFIAQGCLGKESWQCFESNWRSNCVADVQGGAGMV